MPVFSSSITSDVTLESTWRWLDSLCVLHIREQFISVHKNGGNIHTALKFFREMSAFLQAVVELFD